LAGKRLPIVVDLEYFGPLGHFVHTLVGKVDEIEVATDL
jgi:hypothetical protein